MPTENKPMAPVTETPATLRARADELLERFPGQHAERDAKAYSLGIPSRHDERRSLLAQADRLEAASSDAAPASPTRYAHAVYATHNGKFAGFLGQYRTRQEAISFIATERSNCRIRRESMTAEQWARWEASGFKPRTGWSE